MAAALSWPPGEVKKDFNYNDDTWFTLQESDSDEYYRIEHCTTGNLLARGKKKAFLIKPDDKPLDDQKLLWKFKFGDENTFQIINFEDESKLFLRDGSKASAVDIGTFIGDANHEDQFFKFYIEELEFVRLKYKLDEAQMTPQEPELVTSREFKNETSVAQQETLKYTYTKSESYKFTFTAGFKLSFSAGLEISAGIPLFAQATAKFSLGVETSMNFSHETVKTKSEEISYEFPVNVPPRKKILASVLVTKEKADIPYSIMLKGKNSGDQVQSNGEWEGQLTYNVRNEVKEKR